MLAGIGPFLEPLELLELLREPLPEPLLSFILFTVIDPDLAV